ncbi:hypothetical protein ALI144C_51760 [Actinosynnema sp. ALI-1.44]|uniref:hypothetical protein n=1 Tax=Actinosynnema sp. ALI-1.44 TaxID=1933779 RepID=UPI00097C0414|nr:hypothetical protein [Actinosynnema sp. ALI-1.44]ONI71039.1 hypothetical protein ALI144C_51760 [Actinosynnema sp. ALI-1.44]
MSDIFDHPDLRDPSWERKLKQETRRSRWRRNRRRVAILLAVAVVGAGGAYLYASQPEQQNTPPSAQPQATVATTPTTMQTRAKVDLTQPFAGTPAAGWSDGEAGVVVPAATPLNGFTAKQVTDALTKARQAFITANLDSGRLHDHNPEPLAALFAKDAQAPLRTETAYRVRIAAGFKLLPAPPKVNGTLTAQLGEKGELVIKANFSVAYAFDVDDLGKIRDAMDIVAVYRVESHYVFLDGKQFPSTSRGMWPGAWQSYFYSIACGPFREGLLAPAYSERRTVPGVGDPEDGRKKAFDPNLPMATEDTC